MRKKRHSILLVVIIASILFIAVVTPQYITRNDKNIKKTDIYYESANTGLLKKIISIGGTDLHVEIARTRKEKTTGLSHRTSLRESRGMLFIFENEGIHSFWMKNMHFPIDIIWINANKRVVHIEHEITPETYPQSFASSVPAQYVLEVPAGYAQNRISIDDIVSMK